MSINDWIPTPNATVVTVYIRGGRIVGAVRYVEATGRWLGPVGEFPDPQTGQRPPDMKVVSLWAIGRYHPDAIMAREIAERTVLGDGLPLSRWMK